MRTRRRAALELLSGISLTVMAVFLASLICHVALHVYAPSNGLDDPDPFDLNDSDGCTIVPQCSRCNFLLSGTESSLYVCMHTYASFYWRK